LSAPPNRTKFSIQTDSSISITVLFEKCLLPNWNHAILSRMRIIAKKMIREFWGNHIDAEQPLRAWYTKTKQAHWKSTSDVKKDYRNASFVANNRVIFNIKGKRYRLVVAVNYPYQIVYIRFIGTHNEYDKVDIATI
jgi:mRNA interferase HigB